MNLPLYSFYNQMLLGTINIYLYNSKTLMELFLYNIKFLYLIYIYITFNTLGSFIHICK